jgi:hypothetical protein
MILLPTGEEGLVKNSTAHKKGRHFTKERSKLIKRLCATGSVADKKKGKIIERLILDHT